MVHIAQFPSLWCTVHCGRFKAGNAHRGGQWVTGTGCSCDWAASRYTAASTGCSHCWAASGDTGGRLVWRLDLLRACDMLAYVWGNRGAAAASGGCVCCLGWPPRPRHLLPCRAGRLAGRLASDRWPSSPPRLYPSHITSPYWARAVPRPAKRAPPTSSLASCSSCCSCSLPPRRWSRAGSTRDWST